MSKQSYIFSLAVLAAFFISCTSARQAQTTDHNEVVDSLFVTLDTMVVMPEDEEFDFTEIPVYQAAKERVWDLLHTKLDLSFDWKNEKVIGTATLSMTPVFYNQSILVLDAINFKVKQISVDGKQINTIENTNRQLIITLDKTYKAGEELVIEIDYEVQPAATSLAVGGAITSNKGLFFIDPQDTIPNKPQQIWTQGETQYNSHWFPTFDQPNERGTQEIILTVSDTMMTLSNGLLISSTPIEGGMRRDHWKLDLPHAPYLAMLAVGKWDKETDYWRGRTVDYYVDPGFGSSARAIFQHTPEMMEFFSTKLGYDFVWPKYSQVIVKDFVTGAMENSSAVVFSDYVQFDKDDVIDEGVNDYIVAHELFHQWFGDLVTCESWSNLTLNEGFANYGEYLWQEYKFGREQADLTRITELSGYYNQAQNEAHPLIDFYYADPQEMFDAHSYNKGGLVLHMLRDLVGDDAFFASLHRYLKRNEYTAVEVADLRKAFEDVTGQDLNWFFNEWYFGVGHPVLDISHTYNEEDKQLIVSIIQVQGEQGYDEKFILPIEIALIYDNERIEYKQIKLDSITQDFYFDLDESPAAVVIDPRDILLAVVNHDMPESEYPLRALAPISINHRLSAFRMMDVIAPEVIDQLLLDSSYTMRLMTINYIIEQGDMDRLFSIAKEETHPEVLYFMLQAFRDAEPQKAKVIAIRLLERTDKVPMIYAGLLAIADVDIDEAMHWMTHFEDNHSKALYVARASIMAREEQGLTLDFFLTDKATHLSDEYLDEFIAALARFLSSQAEDVQQIGLDKVNSSFFISEDDQEYGRFYLITGLLRQYVQEVDLDYRANILQTINSLYQKETNEYLRNVLKEGLGDLLD